MNKILKKSIGNVVKATYKIGALKSRKTGIKLVSKEALYGIKIATKVNKIKRSLK